MLLMVDLNLGLGEQLSGGTHAWYTQGPELNFQHDKKIKIKSLDSPFS